MPVFNLIDHSCAAYSEEILGDNIQAGRTVIKFIIIMYNMGRGDMLIIAPDSIPGDIK